jgi:hypothetical protein
MRRIRLKPKHKEVGSGAFSVVYRITKRKVVKVFWRDERTHGRGISDYTERQQLLFAQDEVAGAERYRNPADIFEIVKVEHDNGKVHYGVIKEYVPCRCTQDEVAPIYEWDAHSANYRKNKHHRIKRIDTGTPDCFDIDSGKM